MSILNNSLLLGADAGAGGYQVARSLRFNSADSAYLSRTPASAGNRKTFTFSCWIKRSKAGDFRTIFSAATDTSNLFIIRFTDTDLLEIRSATSGSTVFQLVTTQVFRDFSAWYHIVVAVDTTNATGGDRVRLYINGSEITVFNTDTVPTQNADSWANNNVLHEICRQANNPSNYYQDGYLADVHLIDGQQLTPSSFAETNATTGQWVPKAYSGSYGTNGFQLKFADNSNNTAATLGKDTSGNSNNWTPNNLSVTAGAGNDSLVDTPTSYGTDTGAGGEVRGNYATLNPLNVTPTYAAASNGNLTYIDTTNAGSFQAMVSTMFATSGKFYFEATASSVSGTPYPAIGLVSPPTSIDFYIEKTLAGYQGYGYHSDGQKSTNDSYSAFGSSYTSGDTVAVAVDIDAGKVWFSKNGIWQGSGNPTTGANPAFNIVAGRPYGFAVQNASSASSIQMDCNFGQRQWAYAAPAGFKALCDTNLPAPVVAKPSTVMDVKTYLGNNSTQAITGLGFSPDLVWLKRRSSASQHFIFDAVRGANVLLGSNTTDSEANGPFDWFRSFDANGFTVGTDPGTNGPSSNSHVGWCWDAGSSTVTNTQGSITSQVRANASAGFSIVTYTGTGSTASVGHGLNALPQMIIVKRRDSTGNWAVYHRTQGANTYLFLNSTATAAAISNYWQYTPSPGNPTSDWFGIIGGNDVNVSSATYVAYCFAAVAGYSSFGSYTGNGSADGPFVYTGFRPRFLLMKNSNVSGQYWDILDTARDTYNASGLRLFPNASDAENDVRPSIDILSNGFKVRNNYTSTNGSTNVIIYAAFAESPLQYARAR